MSVDACAGCLRRSALVGFLSPRMSAVLGGYDRRLSGILSLPENDLIAAVGGDRAVAAGEFVARFEPSAAVESVVAAGLGAACRHAGAYPGALLKLTDPPAVLYHTGSEEPLRGLGAGPVVTVVGTRRPSNYGSEVARELGRGLAAAGVTVVSGLALGIDAQAHRGALEAGGRPLAVLASGADVPYPRTNEALYDRIRRAGAVVSELPPRHAPLRWSFPARNRIMAGLAGLTVVVEASESSGSLITAEFASQVGHEVGAVPGQVTSRRAAGGNRLLREGAAVIRSPRDVLDELLGVTADDGTPRAELSFGSSDTEGATPGGSPGLEPPLRRILDLVEAGEGLEAIAREAGLTPARTRAALGRLELRGFVARDGLTSYVRLPAAGGHAPILHGTRRDAPLA